MSAFRKYLAWFFYRLGFSANTLTFLGLFLASASGVLIYRGRFTEAAAALLMSGFLDLMDGSVARLSDSKSSFGGVLDSTLDRYGESFVFAGILFYCVEHQKNGYAALALSALVGSFSISYVRARAECEIENCRVGFWERGERIVFLSVGLLLHNLALTLWVLGIVTHWTALQRLLHSRQHTATISETNDRPMRLRPLYWAQATALSLLSLFLRPPF